MLEKEKEMSYISYDKVKDLDSAIFKACNKLDIIRELNPLYEPRLTNHTDELQKKTHLHNDIMKDLDSIIADINHLHLLSAMLEQSTDSCIHLSVVDFKLVQKYLSGE